MEASKSWRYFIYQLIGNLDDCKSIVDYDGSIMVARESVWRKLGKLKQARTHLMRCEMRHVMVT